MKRIPSGNRPWRIQNDDKLYSTETHGPITDHCESIEVEHDSMRIMGYEGWIPNVYNSTDMFSVGWTETGNGTYRLQVNLLFFHSAVCVACRQTLCIFCLRWEKVTFTLHNFWYFRFNWQHLFSDFNWHISFFTVLKAVLGGSNVNNLFTEALCLS